jgi:phosphonate metabolism protein (transferase hexapeptide repeat family)
MNYIHAFPENLETRPAKALSKEPAIHPTCHIQDSYVGSWTDLGAHTTLVESTFGDYSYTAGDVSIIYADVGKFCSIASHARINPGNHPMWRVSQAHFTYRRVQYGFGEDDAEFFNWRRNYRCHVGHDVWIGHGAMIMPGVNIGTGAVVGAGAVVTKDMEPYMVVAGVPARPLRMRFPIDVAEKLLASQWWDWDRATLEARFEELLDLESFLKAQRSVDEVLPHRYLEIG